MAVRRGVVDRRRDPVPHRPRVRAWCKSGDLTPLTSVPKSKMVQAAADWLGVAQWSNRTERALNQAAVGPARVALFAINAPEYLVNA